MRQIVQIRREGVRNTGWKSYTVARLLHHERVETCGGYMKNKDMIRKLAKLETINDQLAAEIHYLDQLARALGFAEGLKTLKSAALEMLEEDQKKEKGRLSKEKKIIEEPDFE